MRPTKHFNAGVSLFIAMALCGTAVAEIEEITVTAQKREENVQDVPISVSTFSDDFFTRSNVNTLRDMARYAPNLTLPQSSTIANQRIIMRGVGSVGNSAIEPTVAVFIDGVYYPRPSSIVGSMTDLERAEVLRGPQGTLFGRNASMGALNIVTKNPTNEHEGRISFGYGDYDGKACFRLYQQCHFGNGGGSSFIFRCQSATVMARIPLPRMAAEARLAIGRT